jgi:hypothetical protein
MSFTFPVVSVNEIETDAGHALDDARIQSIRRDDTVRIIWGKYIFPKIFSGDFLKNLVTKEAHTSVFSFDVPIDKTIAWSEHRHIAIFQSFSALAGLRVRCVPWQIRVEFAHAVRPYVYVKKQLLREIKEYLKTFGWKFTTTDEGFLLIPLHIFSELEETAELYNEYWDLCRTMRGPSATDLDWGDNEFKALVDDEKNAEAVVEEAFADPPILQRMRESALGLTGQGLVQLAKEGVVGQSNAAAAAAGGVA